MTMFRSLCIWKLEFRNSHFSTLSTSTIFLREIRQIAIAGFLGDGQTCHLFCLGITFQSMISSLLSTGFRERCSLKAHPQTRQHSAVSDRTFANTQNIHKPASGSYWKIQNKAKKTQSQELMPELADLVSWSDGETTNLNIWPPEKEILFGRLPHCSYWAIRNSSLPPPIHLQNTVRMSVHTKGNSSL